MGNSAIKPRRSRGGDEERGSARKVYPSHCYEDEAGSAGKVYRSDYDKKHGMVADHKVDCRADDFIERIRKKHITASESQTMGELQTVANYPAKNQGL